MSISSMPTARFALPDQGFRVDGDWAVYDNALLFKAGHYPAQDFSLDETELAAAIANFKPVGGNIEHTSFLKGKACQVRRIFADPADPRTLRGEVAVPSWLNRVLGDHEKKVSCEWDRAFKTLAGLALTVTPAIAEASLIAAFTAHQGQRFPGVDPAELAELATFSALLTAPGAAATFAEAEEPTAWDRYTATVGRILRGTA